MWLSYSEVAEVDLVQTFKAVCNLEQSVRQVHNSFQTLASLGRVLDGDFVVFVEDAEEALENLPEEVQNMIDHLIAFKEQPHHFCLETWKPYLEVIWEQFSSSCLPSSSDGRRPYNHRGQMCVDTAHVVSRESNLHQ